MKYVQGSWQQAGISLFFHAFKCSLLLSAAPSLWQFSCKIIARCAAAQILKWVCMQIFAMLSFKEERRGKNHSLFLFLFFFFFKEIFFEQGYSSPFSLLQGWVHSNVSSRKVKQIFLPEVHTDFAVSTVSYLLLFFFLKPVSQFFDAQMATLKRKHG